MFYVMTYTDMIDMKQLSCCINEKKIMALWSQRRVAGIEDISTGT
jgi:hypothetical protein